jgi:hypothetical protein
VFMMFVILRRFDVVVAMSVGAAGSFSIQVCVEMGRRVSLGTKGGVSGLYQSSSKCAMKLLASLNM